MLQLVAIAVYMGWKKCGTFSSFSWRTPAIYHINILRNPNRENDVDVHWGQKCKAEIDVFCNKKNNYM